MATYRAGELDQLVELQKETFTDDGQGGTTATWVKQHTVWAKVQAKTGRQRMHSDLLASQGGYTIVIRNRPDLDVRANWRIVWQGRNINITFPEYSGPRPMFLVLDSASGEAT